MQTREHIISEILTSTTVADCVAYQMKDADQYLKDEMHQNIWLWLMTYDLAKLSDAYERHHINALVTAYIGRQYWSKNSPFFKVYKKMQSLEDEIGYDELEIAE